MPIYLQFDVFGKCFAYNETDCDIQEVEDQIIKIDSLPEAYDYWMIRVDSTKQINDPGKLYFVNANEEKIMDIVI